MTARPTPEQARARRWRAAIAAGLIFAAGLVVAGGVVLYIRWPVHVGGFLLVWVTLGLGVYIGRRPQTRRLQQAFEAAAAGSATVRDLVEVGRVTDRADAQRCLAEALLATWNDVETPPSEKDHDDAVATAEGLLVALDRLGARVLPPAAVEAATGPPETTGPPCLEDPEDRHFAQMWPVIDGGLSP